jgi:hypothetical protein
MEASTWGMPDAGPKLLEVKVLRHQQALLDDIETQVIGLVGGFGCGKTYSAMLKALQLISLNPGVPGLFVEPTWQLCKQVGLEAFRAFFEEHEIPYSWHGTDYVLTVGDGGPNKTPIWFRSGDRPEKIVGMNAGWAVIDEAGIQDEQVPLKVLSRLRHPKSKVRQLVCVGTPEGFNWFHDWFCGEESVKNGSLLVRAKTVDNPYIPESYVRQLLAHLSEEEQSQYLDGEFVSIGGRVYTKFKRPVHVKVCKDPLAGELQLWCDFNVGKMVFLLVRVLNGEAHVFREFIGYNTDTESHAELVADEVRRMGAELRGYPIRPNEMTVFSDATGSARRTSASRSDHAHLARHGFVLRHPAANPLIRDRIASVNYMLSTNRLFICPKGAPEAVASLEQQGRDRAGQPDKVGGLDHAADAIGYGIHFQWPVDFETTGRVYAYH